MRIASKLVMSTKKQLKRCPWPGDDALMQKYHDTEWGVPVHHDKKLFEFLILEGAQAGLSWQTILNKRAAYRKAFDRFNPKKVARYTKRDVNRLLKDEGIVRNRLKIQAAITNAQRFLEIQDEFGSFDAYSWQFVGGKPIKHRHTKLRQVPAVTKEAEAFSKDLKKRGFTFVGPTIIYAHMQATGMVNDHLTSCFRYNQV